VPFNVVVQNQIEGLPSVPQTKLNEKTGSKSKLLFVLAPNDLVYLPNMSEKDGKINPDNVYKMVSSTGNQCFFVNAAVAKSIVDKMEFSALNKMERDIFGQMIKEKCIKLKTDRIGNMI
jgi:CRISPR-associated endonuclease Csn1